MQQSEWDMQIQEILQGRIEEVYVDVVYFSKLFPLHMFAGE